jgi:preprotein translocase subunit SecD
MNLARVILPNFGSGRISRFAATLLLGIVLPFSSGLSRDRP